MTLQTLNLNAKTGPENYVFTAGNTIVAQGKVDAADQNHLGRSYRFVFTDPTGAVRGMTACTPAGAAGGAVSGSYTVQPSDPVSTSATWKVLIRQYVDQGCASLEKASGALAYNVAGSTSWASSSLTTQQSIFGPGGSGYLKVAGLTSSKADWITTWQLPSGATACANSAGADRADSDASGSLPTGAGAFLQYAPGVALGAAWNLQANYDSACPAFSAANEGRWSVTLKKDNTHFVTLPSFSVDATAPSSSASSAATASSESIKVAYSASDGGPTPSGLSKVELYAKGPADSGYGKVATDSSPSGSGSFDYTAAQSDGSYSFYTVSTDKVGNAEAAPSSADSTTVVDTAAPISQASSPQYSPSNGFTVGYTATAGMARVALYAKAPGDSGYTKVGTDSAPGTSGSFSYTAAAGEGSYSFYTVATSKGGKSETPPSDPDSVTLVDTTAPASHASSPQRTTADSFKVSYTADDPGGSASGLASVDLYVKGPSDGSYSKVATDSAPGATGSFDYKLDGVNGDYSFYTVATDKAGTAEAAPGSADTVTTVEAPDITAPASSASSPAYLTTSLFTVSYSASDRGAGATGIASVDLYAKAPGDSGYTKVATDSTPSDSGSFSYFAAAGDGSYSFYTIATDNTGNVEEGPAEADATTWLDTGPPASQASSPQSSTSSSLSVSYAASDPGPGGSGLAKVELYAKGPGDDSYLKVATDATPGATGSFNYTAVGGDGSYRFYTVATDKAGNAEPEPQSADTTTTVDGTSPQSQAGSPQYATASGFAVSYTASDPGPGASGLAKVELYAKAPGDGSYSKVATDSSPSGSGSFDYTAAAGDGSYSFYTVATDVAGNSEAAPSAGDTTTRLDGTAPTSSASSPAYASASSFAVSYSASDPGSDASGLTKVELYAKGPGDSGYGKVATDSSPGATGSFDYAAGAGAGSYSFYTVATDVAGNSEAAPSAADSTTNFDPTAGQNEVVDQLHYNFSGSTSVAFSWRGSATDIRYGRTSGYGQTATAHTPNPVPWSSDGPFREVELTGLDAGAAYHYSVGGGPDHTFTVAPTGSFRFDVEADVGSSRDFKGVAPIQQQIAADAPDFVLSGGDLAYGHPYGQASVEQHFNDVMAWSTRAAYMPAWGNHEWEVPADDDLRNYKGRFMLPHGKGSPGSPAQGCCGEDWGWFDSGGVRFIAYPEPYAGDTWKQWKADADSAFAAAQADPSIHFIITYGHRPAYSSGYHSGDPGISTVLDALGDKYSKYVLNFNGHSHDYERYQPIHGVTHVTTGAGGGNLETPWSRTDERTAYRAMHQEHMRVDVDGTGMRVDAVCGPPTSKDDITCQQGSVIDSFTIGTDPPPPPPLPSTLHVAKQNANCLDNGAGTATQPFCSIKPAALRAVAGQTVLVHSGTYNETVTVGSSGTASEPITFAAATGENVTVAGGSSGFTMTGLSYVVIQGFNVTATTADGIVAKSSSHITLRGNHVTNAGQPVSTKIAKGVRLEGTTDSLVTKNTIDHNTDYGLYVVTGSNRNQVVSNEIFSNARGFQRAASGIRVHSSNDNTFSSNVTHHNEDSGIELVTGASNNLVVNNASYSNGDHGIDVTNSALNQRIISNSVYENTTSAGINIEGTSTGATLRNNIAVDNATDPLRRTSGNIRVESGSTLGTTLDYDLVYQHTGTHNYNWNGLGYSTVASMRLASGQEAHALEADPKWTSPSTGDLTLRLDSPAIDSADSDADGETSSDAVDNRRVDEPNTPNTGAGSRAFDDRGAYEYQLRDAPPNAALTVSPASGLVNLGVTADASASTDTDGTSPISSYSFDWGDGSESTGTQGDATANHTYRAAGSYTVTVTVRDTSGLSSTATSSVTVTDDAPVARLSTVPSLGRTPLDVAADASASTDTDGTPIESYSFDWGDGSPVTGPQSQATAHHVYSDPGTYTVTVTVTDTAGKRSQATSEVRPFDQNSPPSAALSLTPTSGTVDLDVSADASASTDPDNEIASYAFSWGDGSPATGPQSAATANHTYKSAGTFTVTVTVTDASGDSSKATSSVTVTDPPPTARVSVTPSSGVVPLDIGADASASTDPDGTPISSYTFNWGDGTAATGPQAGASASHSYKTAGTYTVTVTAKDTAGQTSQPATAQVTARPNLIGNPGFETDLTRWNTSGSGTAVTLARVAGGHSGNWSAQLTNGATTTAICAINDSPDWVGKTSAGTYTGAVWVRGDTSGAIVKLRLREYAGSTAVGSAVTQSTLTTSWQKLSVPYTIGSPGSTLDFNAYISSAAPGSCFYADDASLDLK